ncbi:MAG TPA: type II toxin-antitoxin system prevent-host-death family antitoxin [Plasticicumulans sp.]|uniref:type II toxin-antitoxin system Phd/YefM family antitoxin n=1 Tax=Plasticicumulans sp. TaxID=2307179 RepID=UPI002BCE50EE|nr:type II toxin-antitoxin system prevent-host-death family antitoxin [Plasticicumulans sp.]HMV38318.1 type II toxin-antitoxin system prevent-host-death family antitoxin [Plasticicumulans sp.]HMW28245.1 type II toxin-antitoxin system prevent-host-death family antitoxin [Plasticicumulans sp.]HMW42689.1 type II toxin-antitoxin system prevent-host-death family antitoxin [Plasticicumulans sp.]HMZ09930.1 type II toxin-antitoxin system prevent-host-death family antitoxin [Plasticicumulans sp.]HND982
METCPVHEAGEHLAVLIERAWRGEDIIITGEAAQAVKLVPVTTRAAGQRQFGRLRGRIRVDDAFFDPLPEEVLAAWER